MASRWTFDNTLNDAGADANHLSLVSGSEVYETGPESDYALRRVSGDAFSRAAGSCVNLDPLTGDFTIAMKILPYVLPASKALIRKQSGGNNGYFLNLLAAGTILMRFGDGTNISKTTGLSVDVMSWWSLVFTLTGAGVLEAYFNGVRDSSGPWDLSALGSINGSSADFELPDPSTMDVAMADLQIEKAIWSAAQIDAYKIENASIVDPLQVRESAISVARVGAARLGVTRMGFCPKDTRGEDNVASPGHHYRWTDHPTKEIDGYDTYTEVLD